MNLLWAIRHHNHADEDSDNGIDILRDNKAITTFMLFSLFSSIIFFCATIYVAFK